MNSLSTETLLAIVFAILGFVTIDYKIQKKFGLFTIEYWFYTISILVAFFLISYLVLVNIYVL